MLLIRCSQLNTFAHVLPFELSKHYVDHYRMARCFADQGTARRAAKSAGRRWDSPVPQIMHETVLFHQTVPWVPVFGFVLGCPFCGTGPSTGGNSHITHSVPIYLPPKFNQFGRGDRRWSFAVLVPLFFMTVFVGTSYTESGHQAHREMHAEKTQPAVAKLTHWRSLAKG